MSDERDEFIEELLGELVDLRGEVEILRLITPVIDPRKGGSAR